MQQNSSLRYWYQFLLVIIKRISVIDVTND